MPHGESFAGCAAVGDQVALLGGGLHGRRMIVYSPVTQSWQSAEAPHTPHMHCAVASMQSSLFVLVSCDVDGIRKMNQMLSGSMLLMLARVYMLSGFACMIMCPP